MPKITAGSLPRHVPNVIVTDVMVALDLLCRRWGDNSIREINRWFDQPFIEIGYHHDFSDSSYYRFVTTEDLCERLLAEGLVAGKPEWGYTDMHHLRVTSVGERILWSRRGRSDFEGTNSWFRAEEWLKG